MGGRRRQKRESERGKVPREKKKFCLLLLLLSQSPLHKKKRPAEAPAFSFSSLSFCSVAGSLSGEGEAKYGIVQRLFLTLFLTTLCRI